MATIVLLKRKENKQKGGREGGGKETEGRKEKRKGGRSWKQQGRNISPIRKKKNNLSDKNY